MRLQKPSWINHDGHPIFSVDIHPSSPRFATGGQGADSMGRVVIWGLGSTEDKDENPVAVAKFLCQLDHHSACVNCVRWSNKGKYLASGGDDKIIIIWELKGNPALAASVSINTNTCFGKSSQETWKPIFTLRSHTGDILDLAWSPDDRYLASASVDNKVLVWDAIKFPRVVKEIQGHTSLVKGVTWDPVGNYLATQSDDQSLKIWRTSDWLIEHSVTDSFVECGGTTHVLRLDWSPDGSYLVSAHAMNCGGPTAQIVERDGWKTDKDFVGHRKAVVCVRFTRTMFLNKKLQMCYVALGSRDRALSIWSTALKRPLVVIRDAFTHSVMDVAWSADGRVLMACSGDGTVVVVTFSHEEIGDPLSQEEMISLHQRFYGRNIYYLSNSSDDLIQSVEVFIARKQAEKVVEAETPLPTPVPEAQPEKIEVQTKGPPENIVVRGPTDKQIETRTADGKRRITPKFLLPQNDVIMSTAFQTSNNTESESIDPRCLNPTTIKSTVKAPSPAIENLVVMRGKFSTPTPMKIEKSFVPKVIENPVVMRGKFLTPMKIEDSFTTKIFVKEDTYYHVEVNNSSNGLNWLKCQHQSSLYDGLTWTISTESAICGFAGNTSRIAAACEDSTVHILDLKGRYVLPPFLISSLPTKFCLCGAYLLVVTVKATVHVWDIHLNKSIIKSESILPLLHYAKSETVHVFHATVLPNGAPLVVLPTGKQFLFNFDMQTWVSITEPPKSNPTLGNLRTLVDSAQTDLLLTNKVKALKTGNSITDIKLRLASAVELRKGPDVQKTLIILAKALASKGFKRELHILCEDLLGPTHSSAIISQSWSPQLAGVDKRKVLREILNALLADLKWQDFYLEFDELLQLVENLNGKHPNGGQNGVEERRSFVTP